MGSGKTTVGSLLAQRMGYEFLDLDQIIAEGEGLSIADIFALKSEAYFRRLEQYYLKSIFPLNNLIVATGGGTPAFEDNMHHLNQYTITIYLETDSISLLHRLKDNTTERPLLKNLNEEQIELKLKELIDARHAYYNQAHYTITTTNHTPEEIAEEIIRLLPHASR